MRNTPITIFLFAILLLGCRHKSPRRTKHSPIDLNVTKEIPSHHIDGRPVFWYRYIKDVAGKLDLGYLENGFDSLQLRLWCKCSELSAPRIIELKFQKQVSTATVYEWYSTGDDYLDKKIHLPTMHPAWPKSGWNAVLDSLRFFRISELPDMESVPSMQMIALYGQTFALEVSSATTYKFVVYNNLFTYIKRKEYPASNFARFVRFIHREFRLSCDEVEN